MKEEEKGTHLSHCFQDENKYNCKYMEDDICPANPKNQKGYGKYLINKLLLKKEMFMNSVWDMDRKISDIIKNCNHKIIKLGLGGSAIATCEECGKHCGWWCSKSKDGLCKYSENDEWCIHCGQPEERK